MPPHFRGNLRTLTGLTDEIATLHLRAAMRYQHAAADRDAEIVKRLSAMVHQ